MWLKIVLDTAIVRITTFHMIPLLWFFFVYWFLFEEGERLVCRGESEEGDEERSLRGARGARHRDGELEADSASRR